MEFDFEKFEKECEVIQAENEELLEKYRVFMEEKGLSKKTINNHMSDVRFYINTFLLRESVICAKDGWNKIEEYLGDFFIYKCMWSTPGILESTAASLKHFYKYLKNEKIIEEEQYLFLAETIKDNKDFWITSCKEYNEGNLPFD